MTSTDTEVAEPILPHKVYAEELRFHAVRFIWMGHQRLDAASFAMAEEDDITGELVKSMKQVAQDPAAPDWVDRYEIHEQVRQDIDDKRGKRRPMMDIEIECHRRGPRPRLGVEAKRLGRRYGVSGYLGDEGMGAFLSGYYPTTHGEAGMLGYVQERSPGEWSERLSQALEDARESHRVALDGSWRLMESNLDSPAALSGHTDSNGQPMSVVHILLPFH